MKKEEYITAQNQVLLVAGVIENIDLDGMLQCMGIAHATGPIFNPTLYRQTAENLTNLGRLAELLLAVKNEVKRQREASPRKPGRMPGLSEAIKRGPVAVTVPGSPLDRAQPPEEPEDT